MGVRCESDGLVQVMLDNRNPSHSLCFEALACAALAHEHAHRRALLATPAPAVATGASAQMHAMRKRMLEILPGKLQRGMHAVAAAAVALEATSVATGTFVATGSLSPPRKRVPSEAFTLFLVQWGCEIHGQDEQAVLFWLQHCSGSHPDALRLQYSCQLRCDETWQYSKACGSAAGTSEGAVPVAQVEEALRAGLSDLQWSGVGVLDGVAGADSALGACMHLLKWCAAGLWPDCALRISPVNFASGCKERDMALPPCMLISRGSSQISVASGS